MTFSVGMRAPSVAELVIDLAESIAEPLGEGVRYTDADLAPPRDAHEIDAAAMRCVAASLTALRDMDDAGLSAWFGQFITRYRSAHLAAPAARAVSAAQVFAALPGSTLLRNPWSRCAWARHGRGAHLFVAGTSHFCSLTLARMLCAKRELAGDSLAHALNAPGYEVLAALINDGHWIMTRSRPRRRRAS
jgi:50S ribosomal protein L16 3-hydroxylase